MKKINSPGVLLIKLVLYILNPALLLTHGIIWSSYGLSSAQIVYSMKLSYLLILFGMLWHCGFRMKLNLHIVEKYIISGFFIISILSLAAPFFSEMGSLKYTISDFLGFILIPIYYYVTMNFISSSDMSLERLVQILISATFFSSLAVLLMYIYTGGQKVSIPPEIHFGGALAVGYLIFKFDKIKPFLFVEIVVIISACVFSLQRVNLFVLFIPIMIFFILNIVNFKRLVPVTIIISSFVCLFYYLNKSVILDTLYSFSLDLSGGAITFENSSANQRLIEISLILRELSNYDWYTYVFGKGFGALYYNYMGAVPHYDYEVHHAHSSPFLIMLRNGVIGVVFIFTLPILFFPLLRKNDINVIVFSGLLSTYAALLVDQYIYWGALFAISLALCSSLFNVNRALMSNE
ncbi:hypothetical protein LG784_002853 [Vibrio cholerae]|nr:hypothetical protein [Vibrio cholerae]